MSVTAERFSNTPEAATVRRGEPITIDKLTVGMYVGVVHTIRGMDRVESSRLIPRLYGVYGTVVAVPEVAYVAKEETPEGLVERNVLTSLHIQPSAQITEDTENGLRTTPTWALAPGNSTVSVGRSLHEVEQQIYFYGFDPNYQPAPSAPTE